MSPVLQGPHGVTMNVRSGIVPPACTLIEVALPPVLWWVTVNCVVDWFEGVALPSIVSVDPDVTG